MIRYYLTVLSVLFCAVGVTTAQDHVARRVDIVDRTTARTISFVAGRTVRQISIRWPLALPTADQILAVPTTSDFTVNTEWATPAGAGAVTSFVVKGANEDEAAGVYDDVDGLVLPVVNDRLYEFNSWVRGSRVAGGGNMQIQFTVPAGTVMSYYIISNDGVANDRGNFDAVSDATLPLPGVGTIREFEIRGTVLTAGTAGNIQMRFRRVDAGATVRISANSCIRATSLP